jgi:hypothetical protein
VAAGTARYHSRVSLFVFERRPRQISPDWTLAVDAPGDAAILGFSEEFPVARWMLTLNHPERIADDRTGSSTSFFLDPSDGAWPVQLAHDSPDGWRLDHMADCAPFDQLRIETVDTAAGPVHSGLLSRSPANQEKLRFFPGGGLLASSGEPFHLPLETPRLAFSLAGPERALLADLSPEPAWAHTDALSLMFGAMEEHPHFELITEDDSKPHPVVAPAVTKIQCPSDQDCMIQLTLTSLAQRH